ncbi:hypothetical protein [Allosphingosinicella deserti]|uniref:hypothetical protein n=1 Tax=Allosphingosinicella deserti TaxID=2116704 RepID=UPI0013048F1C|nr:hypothetical protein [Sphingomonas deserti]
MIGLKRASSVIPAQARMTAGPAAAHFRPEIPASAGMTNDIPTTKDDDAQD